MIELIANIIILIGALFAFIAALGIYRLPGIYMKMHAATKAGTLGCSCVLIGVALRFQDIHTLTTVLLLILFIGITNPIAAHLLARTAYDAEKKDG